MLCVVWRFFRCLALGIFGLCPGERETGVTRCLACVYRHCCRVSKYRANRQHEPCKRLIGTAGCYARPHVQSPAPYVSSIRQFCSGCYGPDLNLTPNIWGEHNGVSFSRSTYIAVLPVVTSTAPFNNGYMVPTGFCAIYTPDLAVHKTTISQGEWRSTDGSGGSINLARVLSRTGMEYGT